MFICLIILLIILFFLKGKVINLSNPLFLMWSTWILSIVICLLKIFSSYNNLSLKTLFFIATFLVFTSVGFIFGKKRSNNYVIVAREYSERKLLIAFNLLFLLVTAIFAATVIKLGLPPAISGGDRSTYYISGATEIIYLLIYPCFFIGFYLIKKFNCRYRICVQLIILTCFILLKGNKMSFFTILLMIFVLFGKKVNLFRVILILGCILLVFYLSTFIYTKNILDQNALKDARILLTGFSLSGNWYFLYDPLIYLASNLYNLNNLISSNLSGIGLGTVSFKGLFQVIGFLFPMVTTKMSIGLLEMNSTLSVPIFNTFSALGLLYYDFGEFFTLIIMFLIGFLAGKNYSATENYGCISIMFIYLILFQTLVLSFFTFYLGNLEVITNIIVIIIIDLLCKNGEGEQEIYND